MRCSSKSVNSLMTSSAKKNLFAYGSLIDAEIMFTVTGGQYASHQATLRDYLRKKIRDEVYPGIRHEPGSLTKGMLYSGLGEDAFAKLDRFEGQYYRRQQVLITIGEAPTDEEIEIEADTYVIAKEFADFLSEEDWSYENFLCNGKKIFQQRYLFDPKWMSNQ